MHFLRLFYILATVVFVAAQSSTQTIGNIQTITQKSSSLNQLTTSINVVNVLFQGPKVGQGIIDIANTVQIIMNQMQNPAPVYPDHEAKNVVLALKTFVSIHQQLLNTIIGKHGILSLFFFAQPIRVALVQLEAIVDTLALGLIDMIPTQAPAANQQFGSLTITIQAAIQVYS